MDLLGCCKNHSFATIRVLPRIDRTGFDVALVVAKLTYAVDTLGNARLVPSLIYLNDVGDAQGLRYSHDLAEEKPGTDVGLVGTAMTRAKTNQHTVWLQVGGLKKAATVYGPRTYVAKGEKVVPGQAEAFESIPIVHAWSYGGTDTITRSFHALNPLGKGYAENPLSLVGKPAHRIEPVPNPLGVGLPVIDPSHAAFAPIPDSWEPRRSRTGTHDAQWADERAPVRPIDFDPLHHAWAVPDLHFGKPLLPDVPIEVGGMTLEGVWRFRLPNYGVAFAFVKDGETQEASSHLDGIHIDADRKQVELTFRTAIRLSRKWARIERITIYGTGDMPHSVFEEPTTADRSAAEGARA